MAFDAHKNLASSTVATAPAPPGTGSTLVVAAGQGARFPVAPFEATVWPSAAAPSLANAEIVRVTSVATDTFQIIRAQGGTTARAIGVGDLIAETITAKTLQDIETQAALLAAPNTFTANQTVSGASPWIMWIDGSQVANSRVMYWTSFSQQMILVAADDAYNSQTSPLTLTRPGDLKVWRDLYEKQRTTPVGHWITLTPTLGTDSGSVVLNTSFGCRYTLIGKTLTLLFFFQITITGTPTFVTLNLPAGMTAADYAMNAFGRGTTIGIARCNPGGTTIGLQTNMLAAPWAAEAIYVGGAVTVPIN